MASDSPSIKVTASDALEFEAVAPKVPKGGSAIKTLLFIVIFVVLGAGGWAFYGDNITSIMGSYGGKVLVVRADIGPVKVRPEKPGGLQVPDRDKLVYNRIQNGGTESKEQATVERLLPLPEAPLPRPSSIPLATAQLSLKVQPITTPPESTNEVDAIVSNEAPPLPPVAPPPPKLDTKPPEPIILSKNKTPIIVPKSDITKSTVAVERMPKLVVTSKAEQNPKSLTEVKVSPMAIPSNDVYRVQLAAARNINAARKEWDRLRLKNLDVLGNLGSKITKYDSGANGIFYRLRAGPLKKDIDARALCKTLAKRKTGCLVIRPGK